MTSGSRFTECPLCCKTVAIALINSHIDSGCSTGPSSNGKKGKSTPVPLSQAASALETIKSSNGGGSGLGSGKRVWSNDPTASTDGGDISGAPAPKRHASGTSNSSVDGVADASPAPVRKRAPVSASAPLAERMRPTEMTGFVGQDVMKDGSALRTLIESGNVPSLVLWGPSGVGKTTLAKLIASYTSGPFVMLSGVNTSLAEVKKVLQTAKQKRAIFNTSTILFMDEIHRLNKLQQDVFLPAVESGDIRLIAATTENPSFELNSALLSRCRLFTMKKLESNDIVGLLRAALTDQERGLGTQNITASDNVLEQIANIADGDARIALNALEMAAGFARAKGGQAGATSSPRQGITIDEKIVANVCQRQHVLFDRKGDQHFNIISALHKSMRGGDDNAALYWLARQLEGGEKPLYIARRLIRFASEDVGLADPNALTQAVAAYQACHFNGVPECNVNLAQCVVYLARAPKSIEIYAAYKKAQECIRTMPNEPVPLHLCNAPTKVMQNLGYGKGYQYNPTHEGPVTQSYLPDVLKDVQFLTEKPNVKKGGKT